MFFLCINGTSKTDIGIYINDKCNYIFKTFKNDKKIRLIRKNYIARDKFQGTYKKIIIFNKKINFSTNNLESLRLLFQITTHAKEMLISLKTNLSNHNNKTYNKPRVLSLNSFETFYSYEKLFYKINTIFSSTNFFVPYLVNYFLLIYLTRIKLFYFYK